MKNLSAVLTLRAPRPSETQPRPLQSLFSLDDSNAPLRAPFRSHAESDHPTKGGHPEQSRGISPSPWRSSLAEPGDLSLSAPPEEGWSSRAEPRDLSVPASAAPRESPANANLPIGPVIPPLALGPPRGNTNLSQTLQLIQRGQPPQNAAIASEPADSLKISPRLPM